MSSLLQCYEKLISHIAWEPESFEVVQAVEAHRNFWKPEKVKLLLLAESHVYTNAEEHTAKIRIDELDGSGCSDAFVKLVYCLGYGDNSILSQRVKDNPGTWQYWDVFLKCQDPASGQPISRVSSYRDKIALLKSLKEQGVWLLDTCPIGLYGYDTKGIEIKKAIRNYKQLISISWESYTKEQLYACKPERVIVIGKMVWNVLESELPRGKSDWIYQPNARQGEHYKSEHSPRTLKERLKAISTR